MRRLLAGVLVAAMALGACGGGDDSAAPTVLPSPATPTSSPTPTSPTPTPTPSPAPPAPSPPTPPAPTSAPVPDDPSALPAALLGTDWTRIPTDAKVVALTFDAGGDASGVSSILTTLRQTGTPATFFLTGGWIRAFPDPAREVARLGMPLGNHSNTHPHLPELTNEQIAAELTAAEDSLRTVTGREFAPLFRFPFGDTTPLDIAVVNDEGYACVRWTVDTLGWKGTSGGMNVSEVLARVLEAAGPGKIVLMHVGANPDDGSTLDADALPSVIRELRARGYTFVTLQALLESA